MGLGSQTHACLREGCAARFEVTWEEDPDDWSQGHVASIQKAGEIGWQSVSLPGKLRFLCPEHHDSKAPTR